MRSCILSTLVLLLFFSFMGCKKTEVASPGASPNLSPVSIDANFYSVSIKDSFPYNGRILFALNSKTDGKVFITDGRGSLITEKSVGTDVQNFQKWVIDGKVRYTYFQSVGAKTLDSIPGTELGFEYVCDSDLNVLDTVKFVAGNDVDAMEMDTHEFILLGDHHYIYETYYQEKPDNIPDSLDPAPGVKVAACILQEVNNGVVLLQWDGSKFPEFYGSSQENNNFSDLTKTHDYMHMNSICVDSADNNLIVSFRNLNEIIKINRVTGEIMWRLGGKNSDFELTEDEFFLRQHFARSIENGKTLIFLDNGLSGTRNFSRIVEFQLDEQGKTIKSFSAFQIPDSQILFAGSVQKFGDDYFIGGASANYAIRVNYKTGVIVSRFNFKFSTYRTLLYLN